MILEWIKREETYGKENREDIERQRKIERHKSSLRDEINGQSKGYKRKYDYYLIRLFTVL